MNLELILSFMSNIILLMGLAVIYSIFPSDAKISPLAKKILMGLVVSFIGISVMISHYAIQPGILFDARDIVLSISGMFLGVIPTIIGAVFISLYRVYVGGVGVFTGVLSLIFAGVMGLLWRHLRLKNPRFEKYPVTWVELYLLSFLIQLVMVLMLLTLPSESRIDVIKNIILPQMLVFPVGGLLISTFMLTQRQRFFQNLKTIESEKQYRTLFTKSKSMQVLIDPSDLSIVDINDSAVEKYQYTYEELTHMKMTDLTPSKPETLFEHANQVLETNHGDFFVQHKTKDGTIIDIQSVSGVIVIKDKKYVLATLTDITEKLEREKLYLDVDEKLRATLLSVGEGIIVTDEDAKIVLINDKAKELLNFTVSPLKRSIFDIVKIFSTKELTTFKDIYYECVKTHEPYRSSTDFNLTLHNSSATRFVGFTLSPITLMEEMNRGAILVIRDTTIEKERQQKINFISQHDYLTNLYNRFHFDDQIKRLDTPRQLPMSIIIGDVNGLKLLNDSYGHAEGDKLLMEISNILKKATRAEDIVSRWGGDEFAILLPQTSSENCKIVYQRIKDLCDKSMYTTIKPSIAIGCATKETEDENMNNISKLAEERMYAEKLAEGKAMRKELLESIQYRNYSRLPYEKDHSENCVILAHEFSNYLALPIEQENHLALLSEYHDLGLVSISSRILTKTEPLTDVEWVRVKSHPEVGSRIIQSINEIQEISECVLNHHERYDGTGYPNQFKGEEIPFCGRFMSIIDAYEVMTSGRPYKPKMTVEEALVELDRCSGTQFDPHLTEKFILMIQKKMMS